MSNEQDNIEPTKSSGKASSAIWTGIKYGALAYGVSYLAKWMGWIN